MEQIKLDLEFKQQANYETGQGYRYQGKIVQVAEVKDGIPVFKTLLGTPVDITGGIAFRAPAYDKVKRGPHDLICSLD